MKIEDVRKHAEQKDIPKHLINQLLAEMEFDENGNVVDEIAAFVRINELAYNVDIIRGNLKAVQHLKEKRKKKNGGRI